jgi:hypothetical protein
MVFNLIEYACVADEVEESKQLESDSESSVEEEEKKSDIAELFQNATPAVSKQILCLKTVTSDSDDYLYEKYCSICLDKIRRRKTIQELMVLKCEHVFHKTCCVYWLTGPLAMMLCPKCKRHAVSGEEFNHELDKKLPRVSVYGNPDRPPWKDFTCGKCKATF